MALKVNNTKTRKWIVVSIILIICICLGVISAISYQNSITPNGIVIHHSAVPFQIENPEDIRMISDVHRELGNSIFCWGEIYYIGYHYVILPDGKIVKGRPETCRGAHAFAYNTYIGICLIGDFSEGDNPTADKGPKTPTQEQMKALISLTKAINLRYNIRSENIILHKQVKPETECPGENFSIDNFKNLLKN